MKDTRKLDDFSRRYLYLLGAALLVALVWWLISLDSRVAKLNELLAADARLAAYPYQFRVLKLEEGVAYMSSPRSAQMSALQSLSVMFPDLKHAALESPRMTEAQEQLAEVQSHAAALIRSQDDVQRVIWVLDERWLANHGIYLQ